MSEIMEGKSEESENFISVLGHDNNVLPMNSQVVIQQNENTGLTDQHQEQQLIQINNPEEVLQFVQIIDENGETKYIQMTQENQDQILQLVGLNADVNVTEEEGQVLLEQHMMQNMECFEQSSSDVTYHQDEKKDVANIEESVDIKTTGIRSSDSNAIDMDMVTHSGQQQTSDDVSCVTSNNELTQIEEATDTSLLKPPLISLMPVTSATSYNVPVPATSVISTNTSAIPLDNTKSVLDDSASTIHVQIYDATEATNVDVNAPNSADTKKSVDIEKKEPDLNSPIALTSETTVYVKGKRCVLRVDPQTNQLVAYPVKPEVGNMGKRPKGRPRKQKHDEQTYINENSSDDVKSLGTVGNGEDSQGNKTTSEKESYALEGLLGLSDVGPDGRRKSRRAKKKPKVLLEEYEVGAIDGVDEESTEPANPDDPHDKDINISLINNVDDEPLSCVEELDPQTGVLIRREVVFEKNSKKRGGKINPTQNRIQNYLANLGLPVKRGRGRPRTNVSKDQKGQISAFIIPSSHGQAVMMTPVQKGATASSVIGKTLPKLMPKPINIQSKPDVIISEDNTTTTTVSNELITRLNALANTQTNISSESEIILPECSSAETATPNNAVTKPPITIKFIDKATGKVVPQNSVRRVIKSEIPNVVKSEQKGDDSRLQVKRNTDGTLTVLYNNKKEQSNSHDVPVDSVIADASVSPDNAESVDTTSEPEQLIEVHNSVPVVYNQEQNVDLDDIVLDHKKSSVDDMDVDIEAGDETVDEENDNMIVIHNGTTNVIRTKEETEGNNNTTDLQANEFLMLDDNDITQSNVEKSDEAMTPLPVMSLLDPPKQGIIRVDIITPESFSQSGELAEKEENEDSQQTPVEASGHVIHLPQQLVPMFLPSKEQQTKIGLRATEQQLDEFKCSKCSFQAYYERQFREHIASHGEEEIQKCKCCPFVCFTEEELLAHFKKNHPKCICPICEHMAEHRYIIKRHMQRHNPNGSTCDICGKKYKDQYILKMHVKMVHMPAEVLFECEVCQKKFTRKAHLKRHMRIHDPEKPYKCPHCEYRGCERSDITKHILIHEEPKYCCEVCGKSFRHIKNKELHLKRHRGQRDYKCGVCDFYGYTFTDIRKHIERKHADNRNILCHNCGTSFRNESSLKDHQKICSEMLLVEPRILVPNSEALGTDNLVREVKDKKHNILATRLLPDGEARIMVEQVSLPEGVTVSLPDQPINSHVSGDIGQSQIMDTSLNDMNTGGPDGGLIMVPQGAELIDTSNMEAQVIDIGGEYIETSGVYGEDGDEEEDDNDTGLGTHIDNGDDSMVIAMQ